MIFVESKIMERNWWNGISWNGINGTDFVENICMEWK